MSAPVTFLFWNTARLSEPDIIVRLAAAHDVDVLILAESALSRGRLLAALNSNGMGFTFPFSECLALQVYTRFSRSFLKPLIEGPRFSIRRLRLPARTEILLGLMHLPSKLYRSETGQTLAASGYVTPVIEAERIVGHTRTVVVGDLNMNPFDPAVFGAGGFHAVSSREVASRQKRIVDGKEFTFFFNPMWGQLGDRGEATPGTYYYADSSHDALFWHAFDQVLIRPDLLSSFRNEDLRVLTSDGTVDLINSRGLPDRRVASDHLPLLFRLYL